jgi:hypothetical protein
MTKRRWTTTDQYAWLEGLIPAFIEAQEKKTVGTVFLPETFREWQKKWPVEAPTEKELKEAGGEQEKALASKTKAQESVSWRSSDISHTVKLTTTLQRIMFWFHNHTRSTTSGTGKRAVLDLKGKRKLAAPWQAYQSLYYEKKLKALVESAWQEYLSSVPEGSTPKKTRFVVKNELIQRLYAQESDEVKEEVEEYRQKMRLGNVDREKEGRKEELQK